jgi:hypothetical protein
VTATFYLAAERAQRKRAGSRSPSLAAAIIRVAMRSRTTSGSPGSCSSSKAASKTSVIAEIVSGSNADDYLLDLGIYVRDVCKDLNDAAPLRRVEVTAESGIMVMTDRAIPIALMINELITNAAKYANQDDQIGNIWVRVAGGAGDKIEFSVRDEDLGLPPDFEHRSAPGLGMIAAEWIELLARRRPLPLRRDTPAPRSLPSPSSFLSRRRHSDGI